MNVESGLRRVVQIEDENYYLVVTQNSVTATVPYENRPGNVRLRVIVDKLCEEISKTMEMLNSPVDT